MRKSIKKIVAVATAAALAAGTFALASCGSRFTAPTGLPEKYEEVTSNGGFVVSVGNYYYFINGMETYTSDNTYGKPVKGALMRVKKSELAENKSETVIPSLMVAGDTTAGIYVYGDRVYYATPTNIKNTAGVVENTYLDFASAKLDGTDIKTHFRLATNTTPFRYVELDGTVYVLYVEGSSDYTLHSYNLTTDADTILAKGATKYVFCTENAADGAAKADPWIYYTMAVGDKQDSDGAVSYDYNQIYRVRADATEVPEGYAYGEDDYWDMDYIEENLDGEIPYVNLGELVLDGRGYRTPKTAFSHSEVEPAAPFGYTYTLQSYANGGIYFTRTQLSTGGNTTGTNGTLYFYDTETLADSVAQNDTLDVVANSSDASSKATTSAKFYRDDKGHHYLYVSNSNIYRVDVAEDGTPSELEVAYDIGSATLLYLASDPTETYEYVYFTRGNGSGTSVERAVYNGTAEDYRNLTFTDPDGTHHENEAFRSAKVLNLQHTTGWYNYEVIDGNVFYADGGSDVLGSAMNYVNVVSLNNADGTLMTNPELEDFNEKYEEMMDASAKTGYLAKLTDEGNTKLSAALKYFYYTGETKKFYENISSAEDNGKNNTYLYSEEEQAAFKAFTEGTGETADLFKDAAGKSYRTYSYFNTQLGAMSESDKETAETYWTNALEKYTPPQTEDEGLAWWAWMLIGIAIGVVVIGGVLAAVFVVKAKNKQKAPVAAKPHVDTEDDREIDVYAVEPEEAPAEETEQPSEATEESPEEVPSEATEEAEEAPEAENAEAPETGAEEGQDPPAAE